MRIRLFIGLLAISTVAAAQELPLSRHLYREGDVLLKKQVSYPEYAGSDTARFWDFSHVSTVSDEYKVTYNAVSDTSWRATEHRTGYDYLLDDSLLFLSGFGNATTRVDYCPEMLRQVYSPAEGGKTERPFFGRGHYSHRLVMKLAGTAIVSAPVKGTLILPEGDTLRDVLKVEHLKRQVETVYPIGEKDTLTDAELQNRLALFNADSLGMEVATVSWYVPGSRYPVFETVESKGRRYGETYVHFKTAFMYRPEVQYYDLAEDPENEAVKETMRQKEEDTPEMADELGWRYTLVQREGTISLLLEMTETRDVSVTLVDIAGRLRQRIPARSYPEGRHELHLDTSSPSSGEYLLVIFSGGEKRTEKLIIH